MGVLAHVVEDFIRWNIALLIEAVHRDGNSISRLSIIEGLHRDLSGLELPGGTPMSDGVRVFGH
ncbi:hypothetical protein D3C84_443180 [compost metagenome]